MTRNILVVLSEYGYWGEELLGPVTAFDNQGYTTVFATPNGKRPTALLPSLDPGFIDPPLGRSVTTPEVAVAAQQLDQSERLVSPLSLSEWLPERPYFSADGYLRKIEQYYRDLAVIDSDVDRYDALVIVGGSGPIVDLAALTPPRGPVFIALPMDVLDALTSEPAVPSTLPSRRTVPVTADLQRAVQLLSQARNPIMLIGDGVTVSGAQPEVTRVAELLGAPVYGVDSSELNMDTTHPLYRGELGHMFGSTSAKAVADADTVLIVGTYVFPEVFPSLTSPFADGAKIVHVDLDDYEIAKNYPVTIGLVADPAATLAAIAERLAARRAFTGTPLARVDYSRRPALPQPGPDAPLAELLAAELARQVPAELLVFDEALTASPQLTRQLPPRTPGSFFQTRGGSLGVGIPGAIGVKIARPDAEVVGFTGDGGSMYTIQALWTAARYGIPARFVICNNGRYRLLDDNLGQYWQERGIPAHGGPSSFDLSQPPIDFPGLAAALGVDGIRVEKPAEVESAVTRMLSSSGPFLIDLVTG